MPNSTNTETLEHLEPCYVYHWVPDDMVGTELVPLNAMPEGMAGLRDKHLEKYKGREEVLQRHIPLLGCLWNDVVQFSPVHPRKVYEQQVALGIIPKVPAYKFYEIPASQLDPDKTVVFFKTGVGKGQEEFKWLKDVDLAELQDVPQQTIDYFRSVAGTGELPFNYQFIPHVVHKGNVDVSSSEIITL